MEGIANHSRMVALSKMPVRPVRIAIAIALDMHSAGHHCFEAVPRLEPRNRAMPWTQTVYSHLGLACRR